MNIEHSNPHFVEVFRVLTVMNTLPKIQEEQILALQRFIQQRESLELSEAVHNALEQKNISAALDLLKGELSLSSLPFLERRFSLRKNKFVDVSIAEEKEEPTEIKDDEVVEEVTTSPVEITETNVVEEKSEQNEQLQDPVESVESLEKVEPSPEKEIKFDD